MKLLELGIAPVRAALQVPARLLQQVRGDSSLMTFVAASTFASLKSNVVVSSAIDNAAWRLFLPSSLFLSIIGSSALAPEGGDGSGGVGSGDGAGMFVQPSMLIAFLLGTIGSILGGYLSYHVATYLSRSRGARINFSSCATCLTASYIGGTANFFETAAALKLPPQEATVLQQLAAADIGVMIAYFAVLKAVKRTAVDEEYVQQWRVLQKASTDGSSLLLLSFYLVLGLQANYPHIIALGVPAIGLFTTILGTHLTFLFVAAALWNKSVQWVFRPGGLFVTGLWCGGLGCRGDVGDERYRGERAQRLERLLHIDVDTLLIASNACVGGAATAASMAGASDPASTYELILSASVVGILGYLIGTPIALSAARLLC
ncbi:hypothetical protein B484DRAFT_416855 [Ochromonadaceae sp. CCMP2298]|nr:hypothetical protein B484DRAFT_416855 [Ochromonadaceae sp. CCMP2298]